MFKKHLYLLASRASGVPYDTLVELATNRLTKEQPHLYFVVNGQYLSPRQYLIHISENLVKPTMGADFFGVQLAKEIMELFLDGREGPYFVSDSGFVEEALALSSLKTEVTIVRIHRPGYTFEGDSRDYLTQEQFLNPTTQLPLPNFKFKDIHNRWDLKHFLNAGEDLLGYGPFSTLL